MRRLLALAPFWLTVLSIVALADVGCRGSVDRVYDDALVEAGPLADAEVDAETVPEAATGDGAAETGTADKNDAAVDAPLTTPATIGGTVIGLAGSGLVLQNEGGDDLTVTTGGAFVFATAIAPGQPYKVTVRSQPTVPSQACSVTNDEGTANGVNVIDVVVTCVTQTFTVGGNVVGLTGTGLVLTDNGGNNLPVSSGVFTFPQGIPSGSNFNVQVQTQPISPAQTCSASGNTGTVVAANVTSVVINCGTNTYTIGGMVSGLAGTLVLHNQTTGEDRTINSNGAFAFQTPVSSGGSYNVSVKTPPAYPPAAQDCTITGGSGSVSASNISGISVTCTTKQFFVGGNVTGLSASGLVLQNNGGNNLTVNGSGGFTFGSKVASGAPYAVSVLTSPAGVTCTVDNGTAAGTVSTADIATVKVSCVQLLAFAESFDGVTSPALPNGWTTAAVDDNTTDQPFTTSGFHTESAPNAARIRDYDHTTDFVLTSPSFTVSTSSAKLTFWHHYGTESPTCCDGGALEISINGGSFLDIITAGGSFTANGYTLTTYNGGENTLDGRDVWAGDFEGQVKVNLPPSCAGKSAQLRWHFASDDGAGASGWWIDDIQVAN